VRSLRLGAYIIIKTSSKGKAARTFFLSINKFVVPFFKGGGMLVSPYFDGSMKQ